MANNPLFLNSRTPVEREVRRRIKLAVWAYAYEVAGDALVSDEEFDRECMMVNVDINTGKPELDKWWRENFQAHTSQWIHKHPDLPAVQELYETQYKGKQA